MLSVTSTEVGGESQHAEAAEDPSEEAVSDCEGQSPSAGGAQQGNPCPEQAGEFVSRAAETQQDFKGTRQHCYYNHQFGRLYFII